MPPVLPPLPVPTGGPGVVDGTTLGDAIDDSYVDAQGDRVTDLGVSVVGGAGNDTVYDGAGDDQLWGGDGDDYLDSRPDWQFDWYSGAATPLPNGDDTLIGGAGDDYLIGSGNDLLIGDDPDNLDGPGGGDFFKLLDGNITALGGAGGDMFQIDHLYGGPSGTPQPISGNQVIYGGEGHGSRDPDEDRLFTNWDVSGEPHLGAVVTLTGHEQGVMEFDGRTIRFHEIEHIQLGPGDNTVIVEAGANLRIFAEGFDPNTGERGTDTLLIPDPAPGESAPVITLSSPGNGTLTFPDGSTVQFFGFEEIICFAAGTLIDTDRGPRAVEDLRAGDRVLTMDDGFQPLVWTGSRSLSAAEIALNPALAPVRIVPGALGPGLPARALTVSPRHRMLVEGAAVDVMFGARQVLVAAADLMGLAGVSRVVDGPVTYVHVMCAEHQILRADGAWSESFQPSAPVLEALPRATRDEVLALFPALANSPMPAARPVLTPAEALVLTGL